MTYTPQSPLLGLGAAPSWAIQLWFQKRNPNVPVNLGSAILAECSRAGVNQDIVAAQIAHETGYWTSYAATRLNNPAGVGITNDLPQAQWPGFSSVQAGIHAQVAHLLTYVEGATNPWKADDPRYADTVSSDMFGKARTIQDLEQHWAYSDPAKYATTPLDQRYAAGIAALANELVSTIGGSTVTAPYSFIRGLVDVRDQLQTNPSGGPNDSVPLAQKQGLVVHYDGPPVTLADMALLKADASYHCNKDWSSDGSGLRGDGLMYHICIGQDGTKFLTRNLEAVLWHCGAWPQNGTALSVHVDIGDGQHASAAALQALDDVVAQFFHAGHGDAAVLWGHQELSPTSCPGTVMADFVRPYRAGTLPMTPSQTGIVDETQHFFPVTGHAMQLGFLRYWQEMGGLAVFGLPIEEETARAGVTTQYTERARFEWHPGSDPAHWDVQLGRLGSELTAHRTSEAPFVPVTDPGLSFVDFYPPTGHTLRAGFRAYWEQFGGLALFGYPISEEFQENGLTVQYFERARFEWHPGTWPERFDVQLGLLGNEAVKAAS